MITVHRKESGLVVFKMKPQEVEQFRYGAKKAGGQKIATERHRGWALVIVTTNEPDEFIQKIRSAGKDVPSDPKTKRKAKDDQLTLTNLFPKKAC